MSNDYSPEWYEYVEEVVNKYQEGEQEAGLELIKMFKGYTSKYFLIFREGKINLEDKDSRKFISLFISDRQVREGLKKARQSTAIRAEAHKAAGMIKSNCRSISDEDLEQELVEALLTLAKRYKKKGTKKNFAGYVYNAYRFQVYRQLMKTIKDPLSFASSLTLSYNDEQNITDINEPNLNFIHKEKLIDMGDNDLGTNWIHGISSSYIFDDLTAFDRLILKLYYVDGLHDHEIATKSGYHINWIYRRRHRAIKNIARRMSNDIKEDN